MEARSSSKSWQRRTSREATADSEATIRLRYADIRSGLPKGASIALLHIGEDQTFVACGNGMEPPTILALAIGSRRTAAAHFKHEPPIPVEMENAIMTVEDEVERVRAVIAEDAVLITTDLTIREIGHFAGTVGGAEMILSLSAVERAFDRLAAVVLGRPAAHEGMPTSPAFTATLLILREFMHHTKFSSITVQS